MAHRVDIPKTVEPKFPDRCIECGKDSPGHAVRYNSSFSGWKPLREPLWKNWDAMVPVCEGCEVRLRRGKWYGRVVFALGIAAALGLMYLAYRLRPSLLDGWTGYALVIGAILIPFMAGQAIFTPSIDFSGWNDRLAFEFRDRAFAEEFAKANGTKLYLS